MMPDQLWEVWTRYKYQTTAPVITRSERGRINRALKELREVNATPEELSAKISAYVRKFPNCEVTITAIAANWGSLTAARPVSRTMNAYVGPRELTEAEREQARKVASETLPARYAARLQR